MTPISVINALPLPDVDRKRLEAFSPRYRIRDMPPDRVAQLEDDEVEVLLASGSPDLSRVPRLRWLQVTTAGLESLMHSAPWARGVAVTNGRGAFAIGIAEYVMWAVLYLSQKTSLRAELQRQRGWPASANQEAPYLGKPLRGGTMVIVGYGGIGREVARHAQGFGMRVLAAKARPEVRASDTFAVAGTGDPQGRIPDRIVGLDALPSIAHQADVLVISLPHTAATHGAITSAVIGALPRHAIVVNVGRGAVLDEPALINALKYHRILGAVLDVFIEEPLPQDHPFWSIPNVVLTPHISAGEMAATWSILTDLLCENLRRYGAGEPLLNRVEGDPRLFTQAE
jgi:phosphoglycerate dehydrogenase-like enzyme